MNVDNKSGTKYEGWSDYYLGVMKDTTDDFVNYIKTGKGKDLVDKVGYISTFATAILFAKTNFYLVGLGMIAGCVSQSFSGEELGKIRNNIVEMNNILPFKVKAFIGAISFIYISVIFSFAAGIAAGMEIGAKIPETTLGNYLKKTEEAYHSIQSKKDAEKNYSGQKIDGGQKIDSGEKNYSSLGTESGQKIDVDHA